MNRFILREYIFWMLWLVECSDCIKFVKNKLLLTVNYYLFVCLFVSFIVLLF